jgi:adenine-specific DNA glycosylase
MAFVIERDGKFLVRQRAADTVNAHLWEFPNIDTSGLPRAHPKELLAQHYNVRARTMSALGTIRHSITRYRIVLEAFHVVSYRLLPTRLARETWLPFAQLDALPFTSAHRKILGFVTAVRRLPPSSGNRPRSLRAKGPPLFQPGPAAQVPVQTIQKG